MYVPAQLGLVEAYIGLGDTGAMDYEESVDLSRAVLEPIIAADPDNSEALVWMAVVLASQELSDYALAEQYLRQALNQNPRNVQGLMEYSNLLGMTNRGDESLQVIQQAALIEPYSTRVLHSLLGIYRDGMGVEM